MNQKVSIIDVRDRDAKLLDTASRQISWYGIRTDRNDMSDPSLRQSSRRTSGGDAVGNIKC